MLGFLLERHNAKYSLLETKVASELNPRDWLARRDLVEGLVAARLDEPAKAHLAKLKALRPDWSADSTIVRLDAQLLRRGASASGVAEFGPGGGLR